MVFQQRWLPDGDTVSVAAGSGDDTPRASMQATFVPGEQHISTVLLPRVASSTLRVRLRPAYVLVAVLVGFLSVRSRLVLVRRLGE